MQPDQLIFLEFSDPAFKLILQIVFHRRHFTGLSVCSHKDHIQSVIPYRHGNWLFIKCTADIWHRIKCIVGLTSIRHCDLDLRFLIIISGFRCYLRRIRRSQNNNIFSGNDITLYVLIINPKRLYLGCPFNVIGPVYKVLSLVGILPSSV